MYSYIFFSKEDSFRAPFIILPGRQTAFTILMLAAFTSSSLSFPVLDPPASSVKYSPKN